MTSNYRQTGDLKESSNRRRSNAWLGIQIINIITHPAKKAEPRNINSAKQDTLHKYRETADSIIRYKAKSHLQPK